MRPTTFDDIPDAVLADIFAHFGFGGNWFYRRVATRWRRLLTKVFGISHFAVDVSKLQQKVSFSGNEHSTMSLSIQASAEEWFNSQKGVSKHRNIFFYGRGEPRFEMRLPVELARKMQQCMNNMDCLPRWWMWANLRLTAEDLINMRVDMEKRQMFFIPPTCRLLLKDCYVDGVDWIRLGCGPLRSTLFSIPITDIEVVSIGNMNTGHIKKRDKKYIFGQGEKEQFGAEMLRLGQKYVKAMTAAERQILHHSLLYQWGEDWEGDWDFKRTVDEIVKFHEPTPEFWVIPPWAMPIPPWPIDFPPCALERMVFRWKRMTLDPLTDRVLEALAKEHRFAKWD